MTANVLISLSALAITVICIWKEPVGIAGWIVFGFCLILAPLTIWQRHVLLVSPSISEAINAIQNRAKHLHHQRNKLQKENDELETHLEHLQNWERPLKQMVEEQGHDMDSIVALARENRCTLQEIKKLQETCVTQQIVSSILRSDQDDGGDCIIDEREMPGLIFRLQAIPSLKDVSAEEIREALDQADRKSLLSILRATARLLHKSGGVRDLELSKRQVPPLLPNTKPQISLSK
mmetsp:Transcript_5365/g.11901  ORF Transcript_5365/g.11901 Transcript_5365/m.11901 type:complete len:235 (+) Transcript_5365:1-705(+)